MCIRDSYAATWVGILAANIVNLLNPDEIIIGGAYGLLGQRFAGMVASHAAKTALAASFASVRILPGTAVSHAAPLGVAAAALRRAPELLAPTATDRANLKPRL